jgi:hypothetical protein
MPLPFFCPGGRASVAGFTAAPPLRGMVSDLLERALSPHHLTSFTTRHAARENATS